MAHEKCRCWCHTTDTLFSSAEPEYDLTPPPEYAGTADLAFALDEPAHVRVGFSRTPLRASAEEMRGINDLPEQLFAPGTFETDDGNATISTIPAKELLAMQFPNRSRRELTSGKCDTCGDALKDCECVE